MSHGDASRARATMGDQNYDRLKASAAWLREGATTHVIK
jgi:hypothetical protein